MADLNQFLQDGVLDIPELVVGDAKRSYEAKGHRMDDVRSGGLHVQDMYSANECRDWGTLTADATGTWYDAFTINGGGFVKLAKLNPTQNHRMRVVVDASTSITFGGSFSPQIGSRPSSNSFALVWGEYFKEAEVGSYICPGFGMLGRYANGDFSSRKYILDYLQGACRFESQTIVQVMTTHLNYADIDWGVEYLLDGEY